MSSPVDGQLPAAIVIGLDCITGLQTARILARRGVPVVGIASDPNHYCARTRVCRRILQSDVAGEELIRTLENLSAELTQHAVLYPCTDASVMQVARHRDRLGHRYHVVLPETDVLDRLQDKLRFHEYAQEAGLPVPQTFMLRCRSDAERAAQQLEYPCILKPPVKSVRWEQSTRAKVFQVESPEELLRLYDQCSKWSDVLLTQQWIEGGDADLYSCNCYLDERSEPVVTFVARKLRQWPPHTGISCLGEEVRNDVVRDVAVRLFQGVGYRGLGYVEMKRDPRTGEHYLIEANVGRPTGRSAIAEAGGVELLYAMYCDAVGLPLPRGLEQRYVGAKWIFWRQDVRSAFYYWRRGDLSLREWARSWRGRKVDAVLSWSDPGPFLADIGNLASKLVHRIGPRAVGGRQVAARDRAA